MLADPLVILVNNVATNLPRINLGAGTAEYSNSDGSITAIVRQTKSSGGRFRREVRLTRTKIAADPISAVNKSVSASVYMVIDEPQFGFMDTDLADMKAGLNTLTGDAPTFLKVLGGEY